MDVVKSAELRGMLSTLARAAASAAAAFPSHDSFFAARADQSGARHSEYAVR